MALIVTQTVPFLFLQLVIDPANRHIRCSANCFFTTVFKDPHLSGHESLLYVGHEDYVIFIYSFKVGCYTTEINVYGMHAIDMYGNCFDFVYVE